MYCVVGLGNPGLEYANNRHNIGFMVADEIIRRYAVGITEKKFSSEIVACKFNDIPFFVQKPFTYMNKSGIATVGLVNFYKIPLDKVIVIHDELDIPAFSVKVKLGGGHGGHNGLKSIDSMIGKNYLRIRLGIGHPGDKELVTPWVLGNFPKSETDKIQNLSEIIACELPKYFEHGLDIFRESVQKTLQKK